MGPNGSLKVINMCTIILIITDRLDHPESVEISSVLAFEIYVV